MTVDAKKTPTGVTIGTSRGLAMAEFSGKGCEQVYVKETGDEQRPIRLEFWEGYSVPHHAILTRSQATELAFILLGWAAVPASTLTRMLDEALFYMDEVLPPSSLGGAAEDTVRYIQFLKETFKKWLSEVGLPDYFSLDKHGNGFNSMESIRRLLINLVDEPEGSKV